MPLIIDDILLRTLGLSVPPFDMLWLLETLQDFAVREAYNPEEIQNKMKENRMLYEMGKKEKEEYEARHEKLQEDLRRAKKARETNLNHRINRLR